MTEEILTTKIEVKRLKALFTILPATAVGSFLLVLIICIGLINVVPKNYLWIWLASILFICIVNGVLSLYFKKHVEQLPNTIKYWQFLIIFNCLLNGLSWGIASTVFYMTVQDNYQAYILVAAVIAVSSYFPIFVHYDKCFYVFAVSLMLPIIGVLMLSNGQVNHYLAFVLLGYLGLMLGCAKWFYRREFERIRLQYELYEQNEKVKEANESKSRFLAAASHDLRQPLQALGFYVVLLSEFLREPHKKALFDKTLKAYQALEGLLNQLLNISKLNANLVDIVKSNFSIHTLFEKLKNDYEMRAMDKNITIEFMTANYFAYSDIVSVERIMRNLLENALRYTNKGSIRASCQMKNNQLLLEVSDSGIGISKDHIHKIFDEFFQVKNPERDRNKGFGLGLYAVNRLAKLLDTSIEVQSEVGKGSCFSFTLPIGTQPQEADITHTDALISDTILKDKIVMLVDDDDVVLDSISRLFFKWDCQVLTASSYNEAMDLILIEEIVPELLVIDYRLPNHQTGVDLTEKICQQCGLSIPAIILTGDTGEESLNHINRSGLAFLHKPTDTAKLKKKVKVLLANEK
ncbi:ATP-binding response regulator [Aliikangiella sp. IMCC44359]|uniref:ATP-binding response regulator n=1 Tax=Aliikangiella sp. IMCC44359 TaxID=3459125 RepID=UPI00403B0D43